MMFNAENMLSLNYENVMNLYVDFQKNNSNSRGQAIFTKFQNYMRMVAMQRYAEVKDFTKDTEAGKQKVQELIQASKKGTLILIDGESGTGKSTFAAKLCQKEGFFLFDIDDYAEQMMLKHMQATRGKIIDIGPAYILYGNGKMVGLEEKSDELLRKQTEEIIKKGSKNGKKTTVMVGAFRNVLYRTIIAQTLGKYFNRVISIVIHDNLDANLARIKVRNGGVELADMTLQARNTHHDMEELKKTITLYGVGYNDSCWVNHAAVHEY